MFDLLTGVAPANLARLDPERTTAIVSTTQVPTGAMVADVAREDFPDVATLGRRVDERTRRQVYLDAEAVALDAFGSQPAANLVVVGVAYQHGLLPQSAASIERAIELNGVAVDTNTAAFRLGREIAIDPSRATTARPRHPTPARRDEAARALRARRRRRRAARGARLARARADRLPGRASTRPASSTSSPAPGAPSSPARQSDGGAASSRGPWRATCST